MKKFIKILLSLLVLGGLTYYFRAPLENEIPILYQEVIHLWHKRVPCAEPLPYKIGNFSTQFGISQEYFESALRDAEAVWEKPSGIDLFTYASLDTSIDAVRINLIYDYRQEATSKLSSLGIAVSDTRASYDSLKAKFTALKTQYEQKKFSFNSDVAAFNDRKDVYERRVAYWNNKGGAPEAEYNKLEAERVSINSDSKRIQTEESSINAMADEINALVVALNRLVTTLNLSVQKFNSTNESRGESFEEGVYSTDGFKSEIDIYEFSSRAKLVRVLAHELGHALGLDHVDDPKAIMYKFNEGNNSTLTKADLDALNAKCQIK